ncbi:uncharacterized protein A4U43_C03F30210 [Asparagus officinalis]|uniref:DUF538 family protein n=1 Tax=Asparagus officinalis TaxID=4686 RepID=A0A5P1FE23_ASPOF|nr:uncharacterized protein LOC109835666 [Asparagus officinalis]XP_020259237.1 uncharacterized protein LOC109835666 [Asparagus officinalis]XP_020259238.1 uncharacterized protein LOC109835666 [Asparagus officinalis]ONK76618.1 uncharacterized protein A4U43_C03F30210 [Asparagus officinalis]
MSKSLFALSLLLLLLSLPSSLSQNPNPSSTAYSELKSYGFPVGLLPVNVASYSLNRTSCDFAVHLDGRCRITLPPDNYLASYERRITGKLVGGKIADLDGIRVRALFRWWSISGIRLSGDDLVFEVGVASARYPARNFDKVPECEGRAPKKADS